MQAGAKEKLKSFYKDVASSFPLANPHEKVAFIVVSHVLPDKPTFIESLGNLGRVAAVIPKTSERDDKVMAEMEQRFPLHKDATKEALHNEDFTTDLIKKAIKPDEKFVIIDIGGYFASSLKAISHDPELKGRFLGVVEGTENGHQKYEKVIKFSDHPVFSKARSPLKSPEDFKVGKSIVRSADVVIRKAENMTIEDLPKVGVIGFGKIGRSIAQHMQQHNHVTVYDKSPEVMALAHAMGFRVLDKESLLRESDMLFLATGNQSLTGDEFKKVKNGAYLASCTSCDDEMDIKWLEKHYKEAEHCKINTFTGEDGHKVHLMLRGNAVNFNDNGVIGPPIYLAGAEFIADAALLINNKGVLDTSHLHHLGDKGRDKIAHHWLRHYTEYAPPELHADMVEQQAASHAKRVSP